MEKKLLCGREYLVFPPTEPILKKELPLLLLHGDSKMYQLMTDNHLLPMKHCFAVMILSTNRIDDFSPWPCKALNERFPDFMGKADDYLSFLREDLLFALRKDYPVTSSASQVGMLGQSLGGLLNLYAYLSPYSDFWSYAACVSPSSWYPNLLEKLQPAITEQDRKNWYISSGMQEGAGHNDRKKDTVTRTRAIVRLLQENRHDVTEYWDNGSHHELLADRYRRALSWFDNNTL